MTVEELKATEDAVALERFERLVLSQRPAKRPWTPVLPYDYASRAVVEGQHPDLIVGAFAPRYVLDYGCGPEACLVRLLRDRGVKIVGWDIPAYWHRLPLVERGYLMDGVYDLVICREVLEHLTVREIKWTVARLCALSSRFVYVTTRFHPHPVSLLDVATADDLDPTHITMLNQTFLRVLFVLEGFKRRADLETQLDWMQKGRCLVYERV